ncbi:hypothetical protein ACUOA8_51030, partial [Escherichia sp. SS-MK2]
MLTEQQRRELDWEKTDGLMPALVGSCSPALTLRQIPRVAQSL